MYRRFYPIDAKIQTGLMLTDVQKKVLRTVQGNPGISQTGIAKKLGMSRKIIHYHIKLLADAGFINVETVGRETNVHYIGGLDLDTAPGSEGMSSPKPAT
jgi:predicted transcriptional regulator